LGLERSSCPCSADLTLAMPVVLPAAMALSNYA
jgi:hypothetical protein